jgi:betaine-aldehyde dehydrogenase
VPHRTQLFINNEWKSTAKTFKVTNPATEEELFECAAASNEDVDVAVKGAKKCFHSKEWKAMTGKDRGAILRKMGALLKERREEFSVLETLDNGKPITESYADIDVCIEVFNFYAALAENLDVTRTTDITQQDEFNVRLVKQAVGVCGMVTPWNFPLMQSVPKVAPALAAGCTMVLKPSSVCPATSMRLGDLALEAGLPAGALNIITGTGREAGNALLNHPDLDYLSFTGSSGVGVTVLDAAAKKLVPSLVELGGKGAILVFDDVDIEAAVDWVMVGIFPCAGQICSATSRLLVHESIEEKFLARLVEETKNLKAGNPLEESTKLGSLTSKDQRDLVAGFVDRAKKDGAKVLCGGNVVPGKGYFYEATILSDLAEDSEGWVEEIFGPVLAVKSFSTEEEAIRLANDSQYGLGNAVLTADSERCERVAQELNAGVVWKNCTNAIPVEAPFGGFKKSGFGKEYGAMGLDEYLQTKVITGCAPDHSWEWYVSKKK